MLFSNLPPGTGWLLSYQKRYMWRLIAGSLFVLFSTAFSIFIPNQVGKAIDELKVTGITQSVLVKHFALIIAASLISGVFLYFQRRTLINMSRFIEYDLRNDFYGHLQKLPLQFYQDNRTGDLMARATNDLGAVRQIVGPAIMYGEQTIFRCLFVIPILFAISWKLSLILIVTMPLVSLCVKWFGQQIHIRFEKIQEFFSEISARAQENLTGVRVIRAYAQEKAEIETFNSLNQQYVDRNIELIRLSAAFRPLMQFLIGFGFVAILWYGGRQTALGHMSLGDFAAFNLYLEQLIWPLIAMGYVTNLVQRGTASLKRMHQIMEIEPAIKDEAGVSSDRAKIKGKIEFRNLNFRYQDGLPLVLRDISLTIEAGKTAAFIGRTGAGKSTLMNLVPRMLDAEPGMVLIDDKPIRNIPIFDLRESIGYVTQESFLFSESLAENIAYGVGAHTSDGVAKAAGLAGLAEDIGGFPKGFETLVGERGITLSGGQKQRTAIARAIMREPSILILDDSLSAVDTYTEEKVLNGLKSVMQDRTTLIVAHRISTVKNADIICVLDEGRIVEKGTHDELMGLRGEYAELYERQLLEEELAAI